MDNIATIDGRIAMAYRNETPWHELSNSSDIAAYSVAQALQDAVLDWQVEPEPIFLSSGRPVTSHRAVVRDIDRVILGVVGKDYTVMQNSESFAPFQEAIDRYGATIETAGALGNGARVWMLAKLPDTNGHVVEGDKIQPYFLITTAHNGTQALLAKSTPIRVVCQNTLDAALRGDRAAVSIRHTSSGPSRIAEIDKFVEQMLGAHHRTVDTFKKMAETYVTVPDVIKYSEVLFPRLKDANGKEPQSQFARTGELKVTRNDEAREVITQLFHYGKGAQLAPSSAWTAYNAVTEYVDHVSVLRKDGKLRSGGAQSAIFGLGADTKRRALDVALEMFVNIPVAA